MPSSSGCGRPASLPLVGEGPVRSRLALLWCLLNPLFCEWARLRVRALCGESSLFYSLWQSDSFGCYLSCVSSLILSPGHSGLVLTLSADYAARASPSSPRSLVVDASLWATSLLTFEVRCVFCEFFFFPSQVCCSLRFQNSPHTHQ